MDKRNCSLVLSKIIIATITLVFAFTAQGKVYKWTDENGKVHYSDKPIDEKSEQIEMKRQPTNAEVQQAKQRALTLIRHQNKVQSIADEETIDERILDQKNEQNRTKINQACNEAKYNIRIYRSGRPIFTIDENGKKNYKGYTDEEKNQIIAELQKSIKENCNGL